MMLRSVKVTGRPIQAWPGQLTEDRVSSPFRASWSNTCDLLDRELYHLGADNVVLQMALNEGGFRRDGAPLANARPDHPGVILSMDSPHGPLSYPCDQFLTWQDNVRAIALVLEALRKIDRYKVGQGNESYTGWRQIQATPRAPMNPDEAARFIAEHGAPQLIELGGWSLLKTNSTELTRAYRAAARKLHPDSSGGTKEDFQRLQEALRMIGGRS